LNQESYAIKLSENNEIIYEVYEFKLPEVSGELLHGISIVHPGTVGDEFLWRKVILPHHTGDCGNLLHIKGKWIYGNGDPRR
jgi:hypothetical protein